ncbi:MAG: hypothetical protein VB042_05310 [Victivallaceae bacterium]|nr:hypothetical protein [Victivallaceae bacterium]
MKVFCPHCGAALECPPKMAGKKAQCNQCRGEFLTPLPTAKAIPSEAGGQSRRIIRRYTGGNWAAAGCGLVAVLFGVILAVTVIGAIPGIIIILLGVILLAIGDRRQKIYCCPGCGDVLASPLVISCRNCGAPLRPPYSRIWLYLAFLAIGIFLIGVSSAVSNNRPNVKLVTNDVISSPGVIDPIREKYGQSADKFKSDAYQMAQAAVCKYFNMKLSAASWPFLAASDHTKFTEVDHMDMATNRLMQWVGVNVSSYVEFDKSDAYGNISRVRYPFWATYNFDPATKLWRLCSLKIGDVQVVG